MIKKIQKCGRENYLDENMGASSLQTSSRRPKSTAPLMDTTTKTCLIVLSA